MPGSMKPSQKLNCVGANLRGVVADSENVEYEFYGLKPKGFRCRPKAFKDLVSSLSNEKKAAVEEMGFGLLLQLQCDELQLGLCSWLIDRFDPEKSTLEVHGKRFHLSPLDFENIIGVRDGGTDVNFSGSEDDIKALRDILFGKVRKRAYRITSFGEMAKKLVERYSVDDTFRVGFVLFALGTLLCPNSSGDLYPKYLYPLRDINGIKLKNWATYSFNLLIEGVSSFKKKNQNYVSGCILFLKLFYFDIIVHGRMFVNRSLTPVVAWGNNEEKKLMKWIEENGGFDCSGITVAYDRTAPSPTGVDEDVVVHLKNDLASVHTKFSTVEPPLQQKTNDITHVYKRRASVCCEKEVIIRNDRATLQSRVTKFGLLQQKRTDDKKVAELEDKLSSEMSEIEGLTYWQVFQATNILATKCDLLSKFLPMSQQRKKAFVLDLLEHGAHSLC